MYICLHVCLICHESLSQSFFGFWPLHSQHLLTVGFWQQTSRRLWLVESDHVTWVLASDWLDTRLSVFKRKSPPVRRQSQMPRAQDTMICKVTITRCHHNSVNIKMFVTALADHNSELMNDYTRNFSWLVVSLNCAKSETILNKWQHAPNLNSVAMAIS